MDERGEELGIQNLQVRISSFTASARQKLTLLEDWRSITFHNAVGLRTHKVSNNHGESSSSSKDS